MRILHLIKTLYVGGAELHLLNLCRQLKRQGVEIAVAYLQDPIEWGSSPLHSAFEQSGIRIVNLGADRLYDIRWISRLASLLKEERPDILHSHLPRADFAGFIGHLLRPSIPWVCSVHDIYSKSWSGKWTLPLFKSVWCQADALMAISHAVKDWVAQEMCVPSEKVTVIHYGIEPERFARPNFALHENSALNSPMIIGSIGRLEWRKGHECLIRAMPTVLHHVPNVSLLIAGHDPWGYGRTLQALIDQLELNGRVRIVGFQNDVPSFLQSINVFAFASRSEGFGQVVVEAMAAGRPVVASKIPPLTEIVVDGQTGLLAEPRDPEAFADAILWLLMHPQEASQMGKQGQERVRTKFSAERMTADTILLYRSLRRPPH